MLLDYDVLSIMSMVFLGLIAIGYFNEKVLKASRRNRTHDHGLSDFSGNTLTRDAWGYKYNIS